MNVLELIPFRLLLDHVVVPARRHVRATLLPVALPVTLAAVIAAVVQVRWSQMALDPAAAAEDMGAFMLALVVMMVVVLLMLFVYLMAYYAMMVASVDAVAGRGVGMRRAWAFVFRPRVFLTLVLVALATFAAMAMCLVPAIYVVPILSFTIPVMVEEGRTGVDAMSRSAELVRFNPTGRLSDSPFLQTLGILFVGFLLTNAISTMVQLPFILAQQIVTIRQASGGADLAQLSAVYWLQVPASFLNAIATAVTWLYTTFGIALLYRELRRRQEGHDLAEAIDRMTGEAPPAGQEALLA